MLGTTVPLAGSRGSRDGASGGGTAVLLTGMIVMSIALLIRAGRQGWW